MFSVSTQGVSRISLSAFQTAKKSRLKLLLISSFLNLAKVFEAVSENVTCDFVPGYSALFAIRAEVDKAF